MGGQEKDAEWTGAERRAAEVRLSEDTVRYLESRMTESVAELYGYDINTGWPSNGV